MIIDDPAIHAELATLFAAYEAALATNDIAVLNAFFWPSPSVLRFGEAGAQYGFDAISQFRVARQGGSPPRRLNRVTIQSFGADFATTNAEFTRSHSTRTGRQSQTWVRFPSIGWKIVAAHVSLVSDVS